MHVMLAGIMPVVDTVYIVPCRPVLWYCLLPLSLVVYLCDWWLETLVAAQLMREHTNGFDLCSLLLHIS